MTGVTGNVGGAVWDWLQTHGGESLECWAGVRNRETALQRPRTAGLRLCEVDFERNIVPDQTFDAVFLVRPPHLGNPKTFRPFLESLAPETKVVFLSVKGADTRSYIPHAKLEAMITQLGLPHTFVRPTYFMENLTTTLWEELEKRQRVFLPAGNLVLEWVAVADVAEIAGLALVGSLTEPAIEVTGAQRFDFTQVVNIINECCGTHFRYQKAGVIGFSFHTLFRRRKPLAFLLVMLLLHTVPRFSKGNKDEEPVEEARDRFRRLTGRDPVSIEQFARQNRDRFRSISTETAAE